MKKIHSNRVSPHESESSVIHFGDQIKYVDTFVQYELRKLIGRILGSSFRNHINSRKKLKKKFKRDVSRIELMYATLQETTTLVS